MSNRTITQRGVFPLILLLAAGAAGLLLGGEDSSGLSRRPVEGSEARRSVPMQRKASRRV